jgi:hypothetical protein|tara:strand:+ start:114 stop:395 length:282 start_codon:yes stop_codon:yes gene_type:complete
MKKLYYLLILVLLNFNIAFSGNHQDDILIRAQNCYNSSVGTYDQSSLEGLYYDMLDMYSSYKEYDSSDMYAYAIDAADMLLLTGQRYGVQNCW